MLLNLSWLIPGIPILSSFLITILLLSFTKTINRLTKPVSYIIITSLAFSELINFLLFKKNISGNHFIFGKSFELVVDRQSILFSETIGFFILLIMIFSVAKLQRKNGYVRYFVLLGFLSGSLYLFSFSGSPFHHLYDPFLLALNKSGITF